MNRTLVGGFVLLAACGRFGFDPDDDDAGVDAAVGVFEPSVGNCIDAEGGPFVEVASMPSPGGGYGVWAATPFVLLADTTGGLRSVRFDGSAFTETDRARHL